MQIPHVPIAGLRNVGSPFLFQKQTGLYYVEMYYVELMCSYYLQSSIFFSKQDSPTADAGVEVVQSGLTFNLLRHF